MRVWEVPPDSLLQRLQACQKLYQRYQDCYHHTKERASASEKPFEISEMYVFGKFASFCRRLGQISFVVNTIQQFSVLRDSHIEGIESLANRFNSIVSVTKKKPYNPLDHRKMEFNVDFEDFQRLIAELEEQLCGFMASSFVQVTSCMQSLRLLQR